MNVHIQNFQSHADTSIDVEGFTVVLGASNNGKSALVRAMAAALFNKAGDLFVRTGQPDDATVTLDGLATNALPVTLSWSKGKKPAVFVLNGETFAKVGKSTPALLQDLGFRMVSLKDQDLRVQVAGQHDRIFLLHESGYTLVDALAEASRLDVFSNAVEACSTDLRAATGTLRTIKARLETYTVQAESLLPSARAWLEAAQAAAARQEETRAEYQRMDRRLLARKTVVVARAIPAPQTPPAALQTAFPQALKSFMTARAARALAAPGAYPEAVDATPYRTLAEAWQTLRVSRAVPGVVPPPVPIDGNRFRDGVAAYKRFMTARRVGTFAPQPLPAPIEAEAVLKALTSYVGLSYNVTSCEQEATKAASVAIAAAREVDQFFLDHPACPTCGGLWTRGSEFSESTPSVAVG